MTNREGGKVSTQIVQRLDWSVHVEEFPLDRVAANIHYTPVTTHEFRSEVWLPRPIEEVFAFFSDPANLESITPPFLNFCIIARGPLEIGAGAMFDYRLRVRGFPIRWRSKITIWEPPHRFVDEQIRGPYRLWIHEHNFEARNEGTLVRDDVHYAVPFDRLLHKLVVRPDIERIFAYRTECLLRRFGGAA